MKSILYGDLARPAVAVVGVWDPFLREHDELFRSLHAHARESGRSSLAIVLSPDPAMFLHGPERWPVYDDLRVRIKLMLRSGIDAVLHARFTSRDVGAGAMQFLECVHGVAPIEALWLGWRQTLGNGPHGDADAVALATERLGIEVTRLPAARVRNTARMARRCLIDGDLAGAIDAVGRPPVRSRPSAGRLRLAWCPGTYHAVPLTDACADPWGTPIPVRLTADGPGLPSLRWPDGGAAFLAFVARFETQAERAA
jgi:FAD synthase